MKLIIEPFDKQPPEGWVLYEIKSHTVRFIRPGKPGFGWNTALPHRPGDEMEEWETIVPPTRALIWRAVVERVDAKQAKDITRGDMPLRARRLTMIIGTHGQAHTMTSGTGSHG